MLVQNQAKNPLMLSGLWLVLCLLILFDPVILPAGPSNIFHGFTGHINQQIIKDKQDFAEAEICTRWFYQQLKDPPPRSDPQKIANPSSPSALQGSPCQSQYPNGIEGARAAFSEAQSYLSLSLTFYQAALVGDRNDNGEYSLEELKDVTECFGMVFNGSSSSLEYLAALNRKFDAIREMREFTVITKGMEILFQKGYRFTSSDQVALNAVLG